MDRDALRRPPRSLGDTILNRALILKILMSAAVIIGGTLFIFWREVRQGIGLPETVGEPCAGLSTGDLGVLTQRETVTHTQESVVPSEDREWVGRSV